MQNVQICGVCAIGAILTLSGHALAQPGMMHQRLIGTLRTDVLRDVSAVPPSDPLHADDFGTVSIGDVAETDESPADVFVLRKDERGKVLWARTLVQTSSDERGYKVAYDRGANEITCLYTTSSTPNLRTGYMQFDAMGAAIDNVLLPGTGALEIVNNRDVGLSLRIDQSNSRIITTNFVAQGSALQEGLLIRTGPLGAMGWARRYAFPAFDGPRLSFSDVAIVPPTPTMNESYFVVGTAQPDPLGPRQVFAMWVDPMGAPIKAWIFFSPQGVLNAYGDGVAAAGDGTFIINGRLFRDNSPINSANFLMRFSLTGAIAWDVSHPDFLPGRAAVQWRDGCIGGVVVAGHRRMQQGIFDEVPAILVTDPAGNTVSLIEHTDNDDSRFDAVVHREGAFGARFVAEGWGAFSGAGYGQLDGLTVRTTQSGAMTGCPVQFPSAFDDVSFEPAEVQVSTNPVEGMQPGPKPTNITLVDDRVCVGGACDSLDFNNDGVFPDVQDVNDFILVFGAGLCPAACCNDLDFNNDGVFPDNADLFAFLNAFSGLNC